MRPNNSMSNAVRMSALVAASIATIASTAAAQRNLSDPGRLYRDHSMKVMAKGKAAGTTYNLFLTPVFGWTDNFQQYGGQLKYASDDLISNVPVAFSGSLMQNHFSGGGTSQVSSQLGAEFDVLSKPEYMLALSGSMDHVDKATSVEFAPEFDWTLPKNDMFTGAIGGILYWDQLSISGIPGNTSATTLGVLAYLNHETWGFIPEYDLASDWNGQAGVMSLKVSKGFVKMNRDPRIIFGLTHQNSTTNVPSSTSYVAGVRLMLH
jgi:hypothetical protein